MKRAMSCRILVPRPFFPSNWKTGKIFVLEKYFWTGRLKIFVLEIYFCTGRNIFALAKHFCEFKVDHRISFSIVQIYDISYIQKHFCIGRNISVLGEIYLYWEKYFCSVRNIFCTVRTFFVLWEIFLYCPCGPPYYLFRKSLCKFLHQPVIT